MVRNTTGGTKTKGLARKHQQKNTNSVHVRLPDGEEERFGYVSKMLGNGMCEIYISTNQRLIGHIRNKFRGRNKRHNLISSQMIVLVGLRTWESTLKNCDILCIYDDNEINQLKNRPGIGIDEIIKMQLTNNPSQVSGNTLEDDIFTNDIDEVEEDIDYTKPRSNELFGVSEEEELDLDDI
jgi:initiation factor 1A